MPGVDVPVWHGTHQETCDFLATIDRHCACKELRQRCAVHRAMLDQRWLNGLLFMRHWRERLLKEEMTCSSEP